MADPVQENVQKCFESRLKAETELKKFQRDIVDVVDNSERRVRIERLVEYCNAAMTKAFAKKCPQPDKSSQSSRRTTTGKTNSSKATSSKVSKTSSQRQRELIIAQLRREEIEKQNEAILRLAKQKQKLEIEQELELQRLRKEQALRVEDLEEENRRKLAEATWAEMVVREDLSDSNLDFHETLSRLSAISKGNGTERINEWINNSPKQAFSRLPTTAASTNPFGIQIPPRQTQLAGTQGTNEAVAINSVPSTAFVPTLSAQLPVFNVTNPHQTPAVQRPNTIAA